MIIMSKIRFVLTWCTDPTLKIDNSALQKKTMVRFPSPSVTKIKSCMCDLSIFFSFCLELPVCKNSKIIFKGFRQQNRQISRKLETKIENRLEKSPTDYFFYATFSRFKSTFIVRKKVVILSKQSIDTNIFLGLYLHFR